MCRREAYLRYTHTHTYTSVHTCTQCVYFGEDILIWKPINGFSGTAELFLLRLFCDVHCCPSPSLITRPPCLLEQGTAARATADSGIRSRCDRRLLIHILCRVNRQPTSDGRQLSNLLSVQAGSRQLVRICPKYWSDNNEVMCARGLLARRPAAPICWLNWAWAWVRRARLKWGALENLHIINVKQLRRHRESQWINCCLCFLDCKISIVLFSFWFSLRFASSSFRLWWSHHRIKRNVATQRASEMDLAYLVLPSYVYQHFHFISPNWKCYFTNNNGTIWNTSGIFARTMDESNECRIWTCFQLFSFTIVNPARLGHI